MPARAGFIFLRNEILKNKDEDERLEIEALMGDEDAVAEIEKRRAEAIELGDFEIG